MRAAMSRILLGAAMLASAGWLIARPGGFGWLSTGEIVVGGLHFRKIPAGSCSIGPRPSEPFAGEGPKGQATIAREFYLSRTEITAGQYAAYIPGQRAQGDAELPKTGLTWDEALAFCAALQAKYPAWRFRLPNELEWEYACRAGSEGWFPAWRGGEETFHEALSKYATGDRDFLRRKVERMARFNEQAPGKTAALEPNGFGLHDMLGNVWEWCAPGDGKGDVFGPAAAAGTLMPLRGGAWCSSDLWSCRPWSRSLERRDARKTSVGFRVLCEVAR